MKPAEEYRERLHRWRDAHDRAARRYRLLGNLRLVTGIVAVALAGLAFGLTWISPWWLVAPLLVFVALAMVHDRVDAARAEAARGVAHYELATARIEHRWIGLGNPGERFRDPKHLYADDLDLFGRGSLFELLSTARTGAGEETLAHWLLGPGAREDVIDRQGAVAELLPRVDLREEMGLMGEEVKAAVDAKSLAHWGEAPPVKFFRGARPIAFVLSVAAVIAFLLFLAHWIPVQPLLWIVLAEIVYGMAARDGVHKILAAVATPAHELQLLGMVLEKLERARFTSPRLATLASDLDAHGKTAAQHIRRLERLVELLDSARNQFFRLVAAPLIWIPQFALAIEAWRCTHGSRIGKWVAAVGEFEALCSLAGYAYERPDATFPELLDDAQPPIEAPLIEANALHHPLISPSESIPNDVRLGGPIRLWMVSGSNMSGKSTLLRAVGLNAILAWAGAPVPSAGLRVSRLQIGASMRANDSVTDHRSRFYAEINRLRGVVDLARAGQPTLFLLDELLSGTNSHDRRIGAEALIRGLVERGAIGLVTTHDLALASIAETLSGRALNVHFEDHLEGGEIRFDYRLRPGVVTRSNALELMRAVGLDV